MRLHDFLKSVEEWSHVLYILCKLLDELSIGLDVWAISVPQFAGEQGSSGNIGAVVLKLPESPH